MNLVMHIMHDLTNLGASEVGTFHYYLMIDDFDLDFPQVSIKRHETVERQRVPGLELSEKPWMHASPSVPRI